MLKIRTAEASDFDSIWEIFRAVVVTGDTYTYDPSTTKEQARLIWMAGDVTTFVATTDERIVGTYILKPNQTGQGSHVANAGYMVRPGCRGQGVGRSMCEHSLDEARRRGFLAMQFNMVVSTNEGAVALWKKLGFQIVGTLPNAFRHPRLGLVNAFVMHRFL
jgi:L-amino acid N-acyltransferase YncA